jgi:hypothetical protein
MGSQRIIFSSWTPADLRRQVLDIEEQVNFDKPISLVQRNRLFRLLDRTRRSMEAFCSKSSVSNDFTRFQVERDLYDLPDKITELYGRIQNRTIDTQVKEKIVDRAKLLQERIDHGDCRNIVKEVASLKKKIESLRSQYALGIENLTIARYVSKRADQLLRAHALGQPIPPLFNQFNLLEMQQLQYKNLELDETLLSELFELADCFFYGNGRDTMKRYHLLPETARRQLMKHFAILGISSPKEDSVKTAQALIATAFDLAHGEDGTESYYSEQELRIFFEKQG